MDTLSRNITTYDTETVLILICLLLIAIAKTAHANKFRHFLFILFSGKYLQLYGKGQSVYYNWFHLPLLIVQLISFSLFVKIAVVYFNLNVVSNVLIITLFVAIFMRLKFLIEKAISVVFNMEKPITRYNFHKLNYWNFMGMALLPFNALLLYSPIHTTIIMYITIILFGLLNIAAITLVLKSNQKLIFGKPFYFILYLCTLEIAPYLIVAKSLIIT